MKERTSSPAIQHLQLNEIFVFGSNLGGRHGRGAAKLAKQKFGAINGQACGLMGRSYGIPVKDGRFGYDSAVRKTLPLRSIGAFIAEFIAFAREHPYDTFLVVEVGCGLAGYEPSQIAPLFSEAIDINNIHLPESFWEVLKTQS